MQSVPDPNRRLPRMNPRPQSIPSPAQLVSFALTHPKRWLLPAVAIAVLAGSYALLRPLTWEASQALIIRNEAANNQQRVGKFSHSGEMKTVEETLFELVKSRGVLAGALEEVGPPPGHRESNAPWPSPEDVADLRDDVELSPPKGAEFGMTEVFYLKARAESRGRANALAAAVRNRLEASFQKLRNTTAQSMTDELAGAVQVARDDLAESTARLTQIEKQVGSDLAELRILHDASSGESALRRTVTEIRNELRRARADRNSNQELLAVLTTAKEDPDHLVATPSQLLESQPALRRLKEGLVDAQLRTAQLQGSMSDRHPHVLAAKEGEQEVRRHLHNELATAVRGVRVDLRLSADRVAMLEERLADATGKLDRLAALRADYSNLVSETQNRAGLLERAEQKLAEARVSRATADVASLIGRIGVPETGVDPVGPSRGMIALAGLAGGLLAGLGALLLTVQLVEPAPALPRRAVFPRSPETLAYPNTLPNTPAGLHGQTLTIKQALQKIAYSHSWN